jgi:hypothetical protein
MARMRKLKQTRTAICLKQFAIVQEMDDEEKKVREMLMHSADSHEH